MRRPALLLGLVPLALVVPGCGLLGDDSGGDLPQGPVTVEEGQAFSLDGFDLDGGWAPEVDDSGATVFEITGENVANTERRGAYLVLSMSFYAGGDLLDDVTCRDTRGPGMTGVRRGDRVELECRSFTTEDLSTADEIRVAVA
ncbi:hypothetical protein [Nocardioides litoris]|uniref:hypothetical protein n=1 Tax=Nocardioides litoris TaxID=1926648 RepID=UPI00111DBCAD|nr:hypothetical protein [Nocardioides litoris]